MSGLTVTLSVEAQRLPPFLGRTEATPRAKPSDRLTDLTLALR